ncbi:nucleolar protein 7 [Nematolebias whitei]|uniref:nucleolar protein 7 n=1 Tax=Nematolebias whitei TaxID=451745 RepID=UPI001899ABB0|nr:nucleolar protein 7 [Nematolebias whitei]
MASSAKRLVAKKRVKTMSLKGNVDNGKPTKTVNVSSESSDDEVPEEVTFEDSKAQALRSMKQALDTVRREKELLKEKRRKRQELFQEQKKRKLLPAEVLEEIDSTPSKEQKQSEKEAEEEAAKEAGGKIEKKRRRPSNVRDFQGKYTVMTVTKREESCFQQRAAEAFLQSRLYGPGTCRGTNNEVLSLQNKTGKNKRPAVQFIKKDWASKEKKRWIHKRKVPSC